MNKLIIFIILMTIAFSMPTHAGTSTNGGSFTEDKDNVWNLGTAPVEYCVTVNPNFSLPMKEVEKVIDEAFHDWRAFFTKYGLDKLKFSELSGGRELGVSLDFQKIPDCHSNKNIHFMIGVRGDEVSHLKEISSHSGLGLSIRENYDHKAYRNGGVIWIPDWFFSRPKLKHMILHEIGHTLGMQHNSVHVMDEKVADRLLVATSSKEWLGRIETPTWSYKLIDSQPIDFTFLNTGFDGSFESNVFLNPIRSAIGFSEHFHHKVRMIPKSLPPPLKGWSITLEFTEKESNKTAKLQGHLLIELPNTSLFSGLRGPVLNTTYLCAECGKDGLHMFRRLDKESSGMNATGSFQLLESSTTEVYPAVSTEHKGIFSLQVFVPRTASWWSTRNYLGTLDVTQ